MTALRCPVCGGLVANDPHGRERVYCSRACRMRAYRDRRDGRLRLLGGNEGPEPYPRPGLRRICSGEYATRDGGIRIVRGWGDGSARHWTVLVIAENGDAYVEDTYPRLRDAREAIGVEVRTRETAA